MLNFKYNHAKPMFLRLCKRSHNIATIRYKYLVQCHRHESTAANKINDIDSIESEIDNNLSEYKILHMMLQKSAFYQNTILPPIKASAVVTSREIEELYITDWSDKSAEDILHVIRKLTYCYLSGSRFEISLYNDILCELIKKLQSLQNHQIKVLLQCLIALKDVTSETLIYKSFINVLSKVCLTRFFSSNNEELLLISDAFCQLQVHNSFVWRAARKLGSKCHNLSGKQLVQLLFVYQGHVLNMFDIECCLHRRLQELTGNEIGIIARGFFLTQRSIRNKYLLKAIMERVSIFVPTMDNICIASIMKLVRHSRVRQIDSLQNVLISLRSEVPKLSLKSITHIAQAFGSRHVYDEILVNNILKRIENKLNLARLKDIERILYSLTTVTPFTTYYNDFCRKLLNEIHSSYKTYRSTEIEIYPGSFIRILLFASIRNIYIQELLQRAFTPDLLQKACKNNLKFLTNDILFLHCNVKIDFPHYEGPLLGEKAYAYLAKRYSFDDSSLKIDSSLKLKTEIVFLCKDKLKIDMHADYIAPHYPFKEIVFGMDKDNNPVKIKSILSAMPMYSIKNVNNLKEIKWKILFLITSDTKVIGHNGYRGSTYQKYRQLKAIGYTPVPIFEEEWNSYLTEKEKVNHLRQLIYEEANLGFEKHIYLHFS
ncbi:FAST kinase domain-containing protein 5, mitochondrial [Xylocopa sonorina]|uniref:FAST kinase domain-containing protein 5, mitochondrial n=1 Tax=Xylocopa sonorina TaxID=1818115 RepID=UPI00403B1FE5